MKIPKAADVDYTIRGAGIAGLSLADELLQRNRTVAITDKAHPGSGSSGAPLVLINPATGRRAKMVTDAEHSVSLISDLLHRVREYSGASFFAQNGVIRPALDPDLAKDFKRSPEKYAWPDSSWVRWLEKETFAERYPYFGETFGGLVIKQGFTVNAEQYTKLLSRYLESKGLQTHYNTHSDIRLAASEPPFLIALASGENFTSGKVIDATGGGVKNSPEWDYLDFKTTKGQLLDLRFHTPLNLKESISSMGYFAFHPETPDRLIVGSTYEHHYEDLKPDRSGKEYLYKKLDRTLPGLSEQSHSVEMWSGERVSMKDHNPVLGEHPVLKNRYLFSGLGSKGMIQGRYLAKMLVEWIENHKPVDPDFSLDRFRYP